MAKRSLLSRCPSYHWNFKSSNGSLLETYFFFTFTAVVIDREFRGLTYENFLRHVQLFLKDRTQQHLTDGELSFQVYTGTDITIPTGENRPCHSYELRYFYDIHM